MRDLDSQDKKKILQINQEEMNSQHWDEAIYKNHFAGGRLTHCSKWQCHRRTDGREHLSRTQICSPHPHGVQTRSGGRLGDRKWTSLHVMGGGCKASSRLENRCASPPLFTDYKQNYKPWSLFVKKGQTQSWKVSHWLLPLSGSTVSKAIICKSSGRDVLQRKCFYFIKSIFLV